MAENDVAGRYRGNCFATIVRAVGSGCSSLTMKIDSANTANRRNRKGETNHEF